MTGRVGSEATHVRSCHPYSFRSGEWAEIIAEVPARGRDCWLVRFEDGTTDIWALDDPEAGYEFSGASDGGNDDGRD